jgi:hypothetical protein
VPDSNPLVTPKEGVIELNVTKPSDASDLVSVGVFATGLNTADHKTASVLAREFRILTPKSEH